MTTNFVISNFIPDINNFKNLNNENGTNWSSFVDSTQRFDEILDTTIYSSTLIGELLTFDSLSGASQNDIEKIEIGSPAAGIFDKRNNGDQAFAIDGVGGANAVYGGAGNNYVKTGIGADTVNLTSGNNIIISDAGANTITVTGGDNFISTGLGADNITATDGDNFINAGDGANAITVTSGNNIIVTGEGADSITTAGLAHTFVNGHRKSNTVNIINAGDGANTITTGMGDDHITGGIHADTITSGAGNDTVFASDGANTITTGAGNDVIHTGKDVDTVSAGTGDDEIHIYGGTDTISAGTGNDTLFVHFEDAKQAVSINALTGDASVETGYSGNISGFGVASFLGVNNFNITSGEVADTITTGAGADVINGGAGADVINGGAGVDILTGGAGADTFVFDQVTATNDSNITDFLSGTDKIQVSVATFDAIATSTPLAMLGGAGTDIGIQFTSFANAAALNAGAISTSTDAAMFIHLQDTGAVYFNTDGATADGFIQIGTVGIGSTLVDADFTLVA
jgi:Ca2+-binding RTX toxin-like protein